MVHVCDRVADDHGAEVLVAEPAERLDPAGEPGFRRRLHLAVDLDLVGAPLMCAALHVRVGRGETVDRLARRRRGISDHHHALRSLLEGPCQLRYGSEIVRTEFWVVTEPGLDRPADDRNVGMETVRLASGPSVPGQTVGLAVGANPSGRWTAWLY